VTVTRTTTDETLALQAQHIDPMAEEELVRRYRFLVLTIINREGFFSTIGTQDDLVQFGYIGLLAAIRTYRPDMGASFRTYASTCIRNEIVSALRSESSKKHGTLTGAYSLDEASDTQDSASLMDTGRPTPEERLLAAEYSRQLATFVSTRLTEREREVFFRHARGYSYSEIALQLDITTKAVDGTMQRVRKKMSEKE